MRTTHLLSVAMLTTVASVPALAQGGDECAMATAITGMGPHNFDQTSATQSPSPLNGCSMPNFDVWFAWTAGQTVDHRLSLCGNSHDTLIAVYDACGGTELACNDDACGLQSELLFSATSGSTYYFRIGTFGLVPGNVGTFTVTPDLPVLNPANGHSYKLVSGVVDWQTAKAQAEASVFNGVPGHLVTLSDQAEVDWVIQTFPNSRPWIGLFQDINDPNFSEPAGGWKWVTGEPFTYTNWFPMEPNNTSGSGGPEDYAEMFANGEWNDAELNHANTTSYIIEYGGGGLGVPFCSPANPNSTGQSTLMTAASTSATPTGIRLEASQGPPNQFAYFLTGTSASDPGIVLSQGMLCLTIGGGNAIGRYNVPGTGFNSIGRFDASGVLQNQVGTSSTGQGYDIPVTIPIAGSPQIMTGQTWHYQLWHRESGGFANFSNGLTINY